MKTRPRTGNAYRAMWPNGSTGRIIGVQEEAIRETARLHASRFVTPANHNLTRNLMVCDIIVNEPEAMSLPIPRAGSRRIGAQ